MVVVVGAPGPETETQSFRFRVWGFWVSGFGCGVHRQLALLSVLWLLLCWLWLKSEHSPELNHGPSYSCLLGATSEEAVSRAFPNAASLALMQAW